MASVAGTLLRLQWRARSRARAARRFGAAMLLMALVAAYALGAGLAPRLAASESVDVLRVAASLILLVVGFLSFAGAFLSTLGLLLREVHAEDEHLAALPLTFRDLATSRLANVIIRALRGSLGATLIGLASMLGAWSSGFPAGVAGTRLALWVGATCVAVSLEALLCAAAGTLVALAFGRLMPAARRELALIVVALGLALGASLAVSRLGPLLAGAEARGWLREMLVPVHAALRLQAAVQAGSTEAILFVIGFAASAALLLVLAVYGWARLLRHDLEAAARSAQEHTRAEAAPANGGATSRAWEATWLDRLLGRLPSPARAVLVRDLRQTGRSPAVRLRSVMLAIALVTLAATGFHPFWLLLLLYYAPGELAREALLRSLEEEGENLFFIQVVTSGLRGYLALRGLAGFLTTFGASLVLLVMTTLLSPALTDHALATLARCALLAATAWLGVAGCILFAAVFVPDLESSGSSLAVSPAELPAAVLALAIALMCAAIDLRWLGGAGTSGVAPLALPGWLATGAIGVLLAAVLSTPLALSRAAQLLQQRGAG